MSATPVPSYTGGIAPGRRHRLGRLAVAGLAGFAIATTGIGLSGAPAVAAPIAADSVADQQAAKKFTVRSVDGVAGQYQAAYSERNKVLWVTSAIGRPPVKESALLKVDPKTLKVLASYQPPVSDPATGAREAVYGVAVDDRNNTVWVTNTRDGGVAVYGQKDGKRLAAVGGIDHAREVVVDQQRGRVYASANGGASVAILDARTYKLIKKVDVASSGPAGLALDQRTGLVYATDLTNNKVLVIDPNQPDKVRQFATGGKGSISVDLDPVRRELYVSNQESGTVTVLNAATGAQVATIATGAGALSVRVDAAAKRAYVANREAGTVTVVSLTNKKILAQLATGPNPNHVVAVHGAAYVVDKSGAGANGVDRLHHITAGH